MKTFPSWFILASVIWGLSTLTLQAQSCTFSTYAGQAGARGTNDGPGPSAGFCFPRELTVDASGAVYVADTGNYTLRRLSPGASGCLVSTIAGLAGASGTIDSTNAEARFDNPNAIAVDPAGVLYIADGGAHTIRSCTPMGADWVVRTIAGSAGYSGSADGTNTAAQFNGPYGLAFANGQLYVADTMNNTIRLVSRVGTNWVVNTIAGVPQASGTNDGPAATARFLRPVGIAVDPFHNIYVTDSGNHVIRKISPAGTNWTVSTIAGTPALSGVSDGTNGAARFYNPHGLARDDRGNLYVADTSNCTIRKLSALGTNWVVTTIAGLPGSYGSANGSGTNALFGFPWGLAVDESAGWIYVADTYNHIIRRASLGFVLQITHLKNRVVLSWPLEATGFVLETSHSLAPTASWSPLTNGLTTAGDRYFLTNLVTPGAAFFRLHQPASTYALQISKSGAHVVLSWPAAATNFVLETSITLQTAALWNPLTNSIIVSGGSFFFTNTMTTSSAFFRLRGP